MASGPNAYTGTVHFSSSAAGTLPPDYTFLSGDNGSHSFTATLSSAPGETITAGDGTRSDARFVTVNANLAARIALTGLPATATAGDGQTLTVTAFDVFGNVARGPNAYQGTVHFSSDDGRAVLPADYTFLPTDDGTRSFATTLETSGSRTVTVNDTVQAAASFTSSQTATVNPAAAATFTVGGTTSPIIAGNSTNFTVTALDPFNNVATGYTGTADFTSSDAQADFGGVTSHAFTSGDAGVFQGSVTLKTAGSQTITATDSVTVTIAGTSGSIAVEAAAPATVGFVQQPTSTTAGASISPDITVQVQDAFANNVAGIDVTIAIDSNPGSGTLSGTTLATADAGGIATFSGLSIDKAGTGYTLLASTTTAFADSAPFDITAAAPATAVFVQGPASATAGVAISPAVTVNVQDAFGNNVSGASVTIAILVNAGGGTLSGSTTATTDTNGIAGFADLSINKAGTGYTLQATVNAIVAVSGTFDITAAAATTSAFVQQP
ncbi:MAG TPA: hypothetical protein VKJ07_01615, partial [Mycobacteriales bacterium]|nr:hypothetical protein [Mycobacteriales bacterium]